MAEMEQEESVARGLGSGFSFGRGLEVGLVFLERLQVELADILEVVNLILSFFFVTDHFNLLRSQGLLLILQLLNFLHFFNVGFLSFLQKQSEEVLEAALDALLLAFFFFVHL